MSGSHVRLGEVPRSRREASLARLAHGALAFFGDLSATTGLVVTLGFVLLGLVGPLLLTNDPLVQNLDARLLPPSADHWFGTDQLGRDLFARVVWGARPTLLVVVATAAVVTPLGLAVGIVAGWFGGWIDRLLMRLTDVALAFPRLVLALACAAALGPGLENAVIAMAVTAWPPYARLARAEVLTLRKADHIAAIRLFGASEPRILLGHVLPLCTSTVLVRLSLDLSGMVLIAAGLGFLGLGAQPPTPEWGAMVAGGRDFLIDQWWVSTLPGLAIFVVSLGFNMLGDGLRDLADPHLE